MERDVLVAVNSKAAAEALRAKGLMPTSIAPVRPTLNFSSITESLTKIKMIDNITFINNLSVMIKSGLPVSRALKILVEQTTNARLAKIIANVHQQVESGTSLADALTKFPKVFSPIFVSMVRVGEVSGNLDQSLSYLAVQLKKDYDLVSKARGAMMYPLVVLVVLALVGFAMFTFVLPKLTATFVEFNIKLPITTRIVIAIVNIFAHYGILVMIGFFAAIFGFLYWRKTDSGHTVIHKLILYVPVIAPIVKKINLARFISVFSALLKSGMPIVDALEISSHVVGNIYYQKVIADAAAKIKIGSALSTGFTKEPQLFPPLVVQMMQVGEESGTTETVLNEVALFYENDVDQTMKNMSSILEPVLMVIIGIVVGFLAVSLITPIYQITQNIG
ncbi:MAG: type II secretion system F family protein [Candidatus Doudnabacteria bacterium]|nr:type II secretion system F family protein [Candidatus Doudnabacteria bacterium]